MTDAHTVLVNHPEALHLLGACVDYPDAHTARRARAAAQAIGAADTVLSQRLVLLGRWLHANGNGPAEEWYTQLFDLQPRACLELGHHLFGANHGRGTLLARLAAELDSVGLRPHSVLPDHLSALLRLLAHVNPDEAAELLRFVILPGLACVNRALAASPAPWASVLVALHDRLARDLDALAPASSFPATEPMHA